MQVKDLIPEPDRQRVPGSNRARNTFHKNERLCSRKLIGRLILKGYTFYSSDFKVVWSECRLKSVYPVQVAFSISKKGFRHAVRRNLIKRRIREAYRKNKQVLYEFLEEKNIQITLLIIFRGNEVPDYNSIEKSVIHMRDRLINCIRERSGKC